MKTSLNGKWYFKRDKNSQYDYQKIAKEFNEGKIRDQMIIPVNWQLAGLNNFNGSVWFFRRIEIGYDEEKNLFKSIKI